MKTFTSLALGLAEKALLPDSMIRHGIRRLCAERLRDINAADCELAQLSLISFIQASVPATLLS